MGLNFEKRPKREQLDLPNRFIAYGLSTEHLAFAHYDEHIPLEFQDGILDRVDEQRRRLFSLEDLRSGR